MVVANLKLAGHGQRPRVAAWPLAMVTVSALLAMQLMPARLGAKPDAGTARAAVAPLADAPVSHPESWPAPTASAPAAGLFELVLRMGPDTDLAARLAAAGAATAPANDAARLVRNLVGGGVPAGSDLKLTLGAGPGGERSIERLVLATGLGTYVLARGPDGALDVADEANARAVRVDGAGADLSYWSLRAAGLAADPAAEAQRLVARIGGAANGRFVAVVAAREQRFGAAASPELQYLDVANRDGRPVRLIKWHDGDGRARWIDLDRLPAAAAQLARPVAGAVSSRFGLRHHPILGFARMHNGTDFAASWGSPIRAAADGVVLSAAWSGGYGRQVRLAHRGGLLTSYSHMSDYAVAPGSRVARGQVIGYVGASGLATGPHLHFEVRRAGRPVDPASAALAPAGGLSATEVAALKARAQRLLASRSG